MAAFRASPAAASPSSEEGCSGGWAQPVLDEFTAPAEKSGFLERSRGCIEQLFQVRLRGGGGRGRNRGGWTSSGTEQQQPSPGGHRIWLSLLGDREGVRRAKEYIKGICEPELEEREYYPKDMHCIFVGAQSLFLNCLIQGTSADITVVETGTLSIKGGTEPVVMARSHIQQFVNLFQNNANSLTVRESAVKKQFKRLVEAHADKYTMDLLLLPSSLKRELLSLVQHEDSTVESVVVNLCSSDGMPEHPVQVQKQSVINCDGRTGQEEARDNAGTPVSELAKQMDTVFPDTPERHFLPINGLTSLETSASKERQSCKRRSSDADERLPKKQFSLEHHQECKQVRCHMHEDDDDDDVVVIDLVTDTDELASPKDSDEISEEMEYKILVNFFKSMGYAQHIVENVIEEHGQLAEPLLLLEEIEKKGKTGVDEEVKLKVTPQTTEKNKGSSVNTGRHNLGCKLEPLKNGNTVFVPQTQCRVKDKIHRSDTENRTALAGSNNAWNKDCSKICSDYLGCCRISQADDVESDGSMNADSNACKATKPKDLILVARDGSENPRPPVQKESVVPQGCYKPSSVKHDQQESSSPMQLGTKPFTFQNPKPFPDAILPLQLRTPYPENRSGGLYGHHADPSVTGVQRFLESLKTPYKLELKNEPERKHLKYIVIDGSNVAISHGLQKFFSCRGIAIAVDYFWKRGHRKITVFVPQWRTRKDSHITEQHFLTQLQDVGILALTPARIVCGARIASHDDRFLLHLAEKTGGVIVTNDNFRDFVDESTPWREIIQRRLLQYTFAGDIFMVPDDPLGRNGPGLDHFLQEEDGFGAVLSQYGLARRSHLPLGVSPFSMQTEGSGPLPSSPGPAVAPAFLAFPPAPLPNSTLPPPPRSAPETTRLKDALKKIFPTSEQGEKIEEILAQHPHMRDLNALSTMVLDLS